MTTIGLSQGGKNKPRLVPSRNIEKIHDAGHNLNIIMSTGYAAMVNSATNFIAEYLAKLKKLPIYRGKLKYYANRTSAGIKKFDTTLKYDFPNLNVWKKNLDLTDCISDKIERVCKGMYFALSNELGKTHTEAKDRDMLSNMIVGAILLRQSSVLFDEILEKARRETMYDFRPYFGHLSVKCIEYPFGEAFMIITEAYGIDALALAKIEPVQIGIDAIVNIMGDENTYREAKELVENG